MAILQRGRFLVRRQLWFSQLFLADVRMSLNITLSSYSIRLVGQAKKWKVFIEGDSIADWPDPCRRIGDGIASYGLRPLA
ncbi:MAG: hypothetical protein AB7I37_16180 [Pirellulales bacterium]